ncbi:MAG TPA: fibronectin type III domain-containing protein [Chitinophagales bacterium]|nr:fibronectin type III domain-containing protein [Chitinophagales bacterium]
MRFVLVMWIAICAGTATAYAQCSGGTVTPSCAVVCSGQSVTFVASGTAGSFFQWQTSSGPFGWTDIAGASTSTFTLNAVTGITTYVRVLTQPPGCPTMASNVAVLTLSQTPTTVVSNVTGNSATVQWLPSCGGTYTVGWSGAGGTGSQTGLTTGTYNITGLTGSCGGPLNVTVTQTNPICAGTSAGSSTVQLPCGAPTLLSVISPSATSFKASWTGMACAPQYRVYYRRVSTNAWLSVDTAGNMKTVTGLIPGTYHVYVVAHNCPTTGLFSSPSNKMCVAVAPSTCSPVPVISGSSPCQGKLAMDLTGNPAGSYQLRFQRVLPTVGTASTITVGAVLQTITLPGSAVGTTYEITARRACPGGAYSPWSCPQTVVISGVCPPPTNVVASNITCFGFSLSWQPPACSISHYRLYYKKTTSVNYSSVNIYSNNTATVTWLTSSGTYDFFMRGVTTCGTLTGNSELSTITVGGPGCRTVPAEPPAAMALFSNPASSRCTIFFSEVDSEDFGVEMFSLSGQRVQCNALVEENRLTVSWDENVPQGLYFVRVRSAEEVFTERLLIQR